MQNTSYMNNLRIRLLVEEITTNKLNQILVFSERGNG